MLLTHFTDFEIEGISVAVPDNLIQIDSFKSDFGSDVVDNISTMTGIRSFRRTSEHQTASDLGYAAAKDLFQKSHIEIGEIGVLIYVTQKPDYRFPATAFVLQSRLGLSADCVCLDINLACSGFIYGLHTAMAMLNFSDRKCALVITGDTTTKTVSPYDRTMMLLFGDAGSATLIRKVENGKNIYSALRMDGSRFKAIITPSGGYRNLNGLRERILWNDGIFRSDFDTHMKGMDVFGFSITDVPKLMKEFLEELGTNPESYDCFALHQPNTYMLKKIAQKLKIPNDKLLISIDRYGNNSSTSIPLVLADHYGELEGDSLRVFMSGFGAGLSWGCIDINVIRNKIFPIVYT